MHMVHPHACGEHLGSVALDKPKRGSPPRMWGTRMTVNLAGVTVRFTPTHVGNTTML